MTKEIENKDQMGLMFNPEWANLGEDDVKDDKVTLGYLKCIQKMSPEFDLDGVNLGDFYNTTEEKSLGKDVDIVIVKKTVDWARFPANGDAPGTPILWSEDGVTWSDGTKLSEEDQWKKKRMRFYITLKDSPSTIPLILLFKGTSRKAGEYIGSMIKRNQKITKEPIFARSYKLTSFSETNNDKQSYQVLKATLNSGFVDQETMNIAYQARLVSEAHTTSYDVSNEDTIIKDGNRTPEPTRVNVFDKLDDLGLE